MMYLFCSSLLIILALFVVLFHCLVVALFLIFVVLFSQKISIEILWGSHYKDGIHVVGCFGRNMRLYCCGNIWNIYVCVCVIVISVKDIGWYIYIVMEE